MGRLSKDGSQTVQIVYVWMNKPYYVHIQWNLSNGGHPWETNLLTVIHR